MSRDRTLSGEGAYRLLLRLYPGDFRRLYGDEMVDVFRCCRDRARHRGGRAGFWLATTYDLVSNALLLRLSRLGSNIGGRSLAIVPAAGSGTLAAGVCCAAVCCTGHAALLGSLGIAGGAVVMAAAGLWLVALFAPALTELLHRH